MELQFQSFHVLFAFLLFVFIVVKIVKRSIAKNPSPKLPPGPRKLPLIGNMHQLGGSLLHHTLRDFAMKYGPLMHLKLGEVSTIVVSSPEIAKEVMKTHDIIFSQRPNLLVPRIMSYDCTNIVFAPYGDYWRQLRKICTVELFSSKCVQLFRSIREEEVSNLIRTISSHGRSPINLSEKFFSLADDIISRAAFGKKCKDKDAFISVVTAVIDYSGGFPIAEMYPSVKWLPLISGIKGKLEKVQREADRLLENILNEHKEKETTTKTIKGEADEDLVDVLLKFQKHGDLKFPLSDNSIKAVILDIFVAGSETSATTAAWAMSEMLKNPRVMKKAQAEVRQVFDGIGNVDETGIHELIQKYESNSYESWFSPFYVNCGYNPRSPLDLNPTPYLTRINGKAKDFIKHVQEVHQTTHQHLEDATAKYKRDANRKRRLVGFAEGDYVYAVLTKDRFSVWEYHKLAARKIGPMEIVEKINPNAYWLKLPSHIRTHVVFNVKHLVSYHGYNSDDEITNSRVNSLQLGEDYADRIGLLAQDFMDQLDRKKGYKQSWGSGAIL